jgi:S-adenosylmethionine uptake transporter
MPMPTAMTNRAAAKPALAFLVACIGIGTFSLMDAAMKELALAAGAYSATLWRNATGAAMMSLLFVGTRQSWPAASVLRLHLLRSSIVAIMAVSFFWSLTVLPLAEAIGLSFIAPVIALYLAAILLGEKIGRAAIIGSVAGLLGTAIILFGKFSGEYGEGAILGTAAVLFSAILYAYNLVLQRQQALLAGPIEIAFFQNLLVAAILSLAAPWWLAPLTEFSLTLAAAGLATVSVLMLSWAYARAEAQVLIPVEYTAFVWAAIFGWLFFAEPVTGWTIAGTTLIVAGSLVAARVKPEPVNQVEMASV